MQKKDFLYFLTDDQGRCYKTDAHGNVFCDADVKPLNFTPDGWQDKTINYSRNSTYFGMVRAFTVPLKFVKDGADIVRYLFYNNGIEAICYLRIAKLNRSTGNHERYFVGLLDFSSFSDDVTEIEISILDNGLDSMIKNKEGTTYEIPIGPDTTDPVPIGNDPSVNVYLDGLMLQNNYNYSTFLGNVYGPPGSPGYGDQWIDIIFINNEGELSYVKTQNVSFEPIDNIGDVRQSNKWFMQATEDVSITVTLNYNIDIASPFSENFAVIWLGDSNTPNVAMLTENMVGNKTTGFKNFSGQKSVSLNLTAGQNLYMITEVWAGEPPGTGPGNIIIRYNQFDLTVSVMSRAPATYCKALKPSFIYQRLIHKLSGLINNAKSDLLDSNDNISRYSILMTTGDAIRRIDDITMKVTFQDFFKAMNVIFNAGFGVDHEVGVLELKSYFYDKDNVLAELDDISNLQVSVDKDDIFNLINIGYPEQTYDDVNGKDEFNNTSEFSAPITRIQNALDLVSPYRADMYGIEFTRIQNIGQDTTDTSSDDTIFFLVVENKVYTDPESGEPFYKLYRPAGVTVTGVLSPGTAFNVEISPKHLLMRHGNYLHAMCDKLETKDLVFQSADKNDTMAVNYPADPLLANSKPVTIAESTNVPVHSLDKKLFLPYVFEFDTDIPGGVKNVFDNNPRGVVQFSWNGNIYKGFIMDCSIKPAFKESQSWKLLASPDNDMTKLISNG